MNTSRWQNWLTCLTIVLLPTQLGKHFWPAFATVNGIRIDYLAPTLYLTDILIGATFLVWLFSNWENIISRKAWQSVPLNPLDISMAVLGATGLFFSTIFSVSMPLSLIGLIKLAECGFFGWMCVQIFRDEQYRPYIWLALSGGLLLESLLAIGQLLNHGSLGGLWYFVGERSFSSDTPWIANASLSGTLVLRPYGTLPHPNVLAGYLLTIGTVVFMQQKEVQFKGKVFMFSSCVIGYLALLTTLSRIPIFIGSLLILLYLLQLLRRHYMTPERQLKIGRLTTIVILIGFCSVIFFPLMSDVSNRFLSSNIQEESVVEREHLVAASLEMLVEHPFFGVGIHGFLPSLPRYLSTSGEVLLLQPVHNIILLLAVETGMVGELVAMYFLFRLFIYRHTYQSSAGIPLILLLLCNQLDHYALTLQQGQLLVTLLIAYALTRKTVKNQEQTMSQQIF